MSEASAILAMVGVRLGVSVIPALAAPSGRFVAYAPAEALERESVESLVRVWIAPPDRAREEREGADGEGYGVCRGRLWWRYDPDNGAMSNEEQPDVGTGIGDELRRLLDPAGLIGAPDFGEISAGHRAGRPTLRVRAVPRAVGDGHDHDALVDVAAGLVRAPSEPPSLGS